jgi:hypothetical protein
MKAMKRMKKERMNDFFVPSTLPHDQR